MQKKSIVFSMLLLLLLNMLTMSLTIQLGKSDPGVIHVGPGGDYGTISDAITHAASGDTILVSSGTYNEEVAISKPLTILGVDADTTIIDGTGLTLTQDGLVTITATGDVTLSGFTISNAPVVPNSDDLRICLLTKSSVADPTYTISHNKLYGSNNPDEYNDYGFYARGKENISFTHNLVTQTGNNNMVLEQHTGSTEISYNALDAGVWGIDSIFFMTYDGVDVTTLQNVSYNTFDLGTGAGFDYDHRATGVSFCAPGPFWGLGEAKFTSMVISRNTFNNLQSNRRGVGFWIGGTGNDLVSPIVTENTITGIGKPASSSGIDFIGSGDVSGANIIGNTITGTETAIELRSGDAFGATINYNNIEGNTVGLNWTIGSTADARFNYWGDGTGPNDPIRNPQGKGDRIIANATFEPWLKAPYPPAQAVSALLYVNPSSVTYWTLSFGKTFNVAVNLDNVNGLFGFDFNLTWNPSLLHLVGIHDTVPWSNPQISDNVTDQLNGRYELSAAGYDAFSGSTTLATLTFQIIYDPISPASQTCTLNLTKAALAGQNGAHIYHMEHNGQYTIHSTKPTLRVTPSSITMNAIGHSFAINVTVSDFVNLYNYTIQLSFDPTLLQVLNLQDGPFLNHPITSIHLVDNSHGLVSLSVWSIDGAPPANGSGVLATITFNVTRGSLARCDKDGNIIPNILSCALHLHDTILKTNTGAVVACDITDGVYRYQPKLGDLNYDGIVGLTDVRKVTGYWKTGNTVADINQDGIVDTYDLAAVTSNYGKDC